VTALSSDAKKARHYKAALTSFIAIVEANLRMIDDIMQEPESHERGRKIAHVVNNIELQKDIAKRYGLHP
jgi:hypothetical protein